MTFILLTLDKDRHGIWVTRLAECLEQHGTIIQILSIEEILHGTTDQILKKHHWKGIINRVSDAADPILFKSVVAFLQAARVMGIAIWNGPDAYSLCGNKWCHHILFQQAGLVAPTTTVTFGSKSLPKDHTTAFSENEPLLAKPNAGGFGVGVQLVDPQERNDLPSSSDNVTLLQQYFPTDHIYRVWFSRGRVQCGVVRSVRGESDFTTGCTGQVCTKRPAQNNEALFVSEDIQREIKSLCRLVPDAHSGSVEFLYDEKGRRLYFDLNLLSTLPLPETIQNSALVWGADYDPWKQQANEILSFFGDHII
ncbi:hypothetical protein FisN_25Hh149 [Fistulifera solaris]|jgi:hypothetical protein|uniref:ATP-grasp domain-containing protein n=1 Tax=Fistulifera solaris TaxID=1519565 RepID=A0A1Z5JW98_FISSO|nr:hypothetical protein FisN_25Hh149 [Fistulifera solaris]|eukprot:GAX18166.1 hypothetical protein FisN_25Hh149 [Fistulifera solaris]